MARPKKQPCAAAATARPIIRTVKLGASAAITCPTRKSATTARSAGLRGKRAATSASSGPPITTLMA